MVKLIKTLRSEENICGIIPDGPKGPRHKVQPGIILMAKKLNFPIIPISYSAKYLKVFNSWDRFVLPYPFNQCTLIYGDPLWMTKDKTQDGIQKDKKRLENELNRITQKADAIYNHNQIE